jgi:hypothetical protein
VQLGEALINLGPQFVKAISGMSDFAKGLNSTSSAVDTFVNNPNWANFNKLLQAMGSQPIVKGSVLDTLANGKSQDTGFLAGMVDNYMKAFQQFGKIFTDATTNTSDESTAAIAANIRYLEDLLANLKQAAAEGQDVKLETDDAEARLARLRAALAETQAAGVTAANTISGQFAQAFRIAENASMDALAKMNAELAGAATSKPLPTVTRYGGDPNKITLPGQSQFGVTKSSGGAETDSYQTNANGSGVNVRSYGAPDPNTKATAGYTQETADNVSKLDANSKHYFDGLSSDIGGYSRQQMAQQTVAISKLSEVAAWMKLDSYSLAALVHNNDSGATGTGKTMFGDAFDSQYGSYISSWGVGSTKRPRSISRRHRATAPMTPPSTSSNRARPST